MSLLPSLVYVFGCGMTFACEGRDEGGYGGAMVPGSVVMKWVW